MPLSEIKKFLLTTIAGIFCFLLLLSPSAAEEQKFTVNVNPGFYQADESRISSLPLAYQILHKHYQAVGGLENLKKIRTVYSEGTSRLDGIHGSFKSWEKWPILYRNEESLDVVTIIEGDSGRDSWLLDTNGQVLVHKDQDTIKRRKLAGELARYEHLNPDSPHFSLLFNGVEEIADATCYKITIANTINSDIYHFFFDTGSFLLLKSAIKQPDVEIISHFDDFRQVDGITVPFHQKSQYVPWEKESEQHVAVYRHNDPIADDFFAVPEKKRDFHFLKNRQSATIPFLFIENQIFIPVEIKNTLHYWVVDSGASMSVIDYDYACELSLSVQGTIKGRGFGDLFELSFVDIPSYSVGEVVFDMQTIFAKKDLRSNSYDPEITGILGYDFLSRFVVEIDYDRQVLILHNPETYKYTGNGLMIPAPLKYNTFTIPVELENRDKGIWSVDLGAYRSSIHYRFAEKKKLLDMEGVEAVSQGLSGITVEKTVQFKSLNIADFKLDNHLITIPQKQGTGTTALAEVAGNLGNETLRNFHLILNYPEQKIILARGDNFNAPFPRDHSGMVIGRSGTDQPMISFVAKKSPGERGGFLAGDIITKINGAPISPQDSTTELRRLLRKKPGTIHVITVNREGSDHELSIKLQELWPTRSLR